MFKNAKIFSSFSVSDLEKAKAFYGETLGLKVTEEKEMGLLNIHLAGDDYIMVYPKDNHSPASFTVLNFLVDNIDQAVDELTNKGVQFEKFEGFHQDEKGIGRGLAEKKGPDIAWFKDLSGNILAVMQVK